MEKKTLTFLHQATGLYHRYGIKSVTMDEVAHHLGISKKTLYEHFRNKEDLVGSVIFLEHDRQRRYFDEIRKKKLNAIEELMEVYRIINRVLRDYHPSIEYDVRKYYPSLFMKLRNLRREGLYESTYRNLIKGQKEGLYRKEMNADIISRLHVARFEYLSENDVFTNDELTSVKVFHEIFLYHIFGILNDKGRVFFSKNFEKYKANMVIADT
ncbi:MAG TPA: TetR/AcrR family transcriptional regulator [Bacteroidales bacterium]|nr:TetR/AcrR family transcriptional regulator [Bacteroidales bacterium]